MRASVEKSPKTVRLPQERGQFMRLFPRGGELNFCHFAASLTRSHAELFISV